MERKLAREILASLPEGKHFRYFKDRYALQLLAYTAAEERSLSGLRRGRFRPLVQKPVIRRIVAEQGARGVNWDLLDSYFPAGTEDYPLTLALWGDERAATSWAQTTRAGLNVVVQLNFPAAHDRAYRRYIEPIEHPFEAWWHPIHRKGRHTLAWSRVDIDPQRGEALIEEIQSDWIRDATFAAEQALESLVAGELDLPWWIDRVGCDALQLFRYVESVLRNHRRIWDEAMLAATLWLLREHLGLRRIYMHTYDGGCLLKKIRHRRPPRSIYEQLPRRFCFERVTGVPGFLLRDLPASARVPWLEFWRLRV